MPQWQEAGEKAIKRVVWSDKVQYNFLKMQTSIKSIVNETTIINAEQKLYVVETFGPRFACPSEITQF